MVSYPRLRTNDISAQNLFPPACQPHTTTDFFLPVNMIQSTIYVHISVKGLYILIVCLSVWLILISEEAAYSFYNVPMVLSFPPFYHSAHIIVAHLLISYSCTTVFQPISGL